MKVFLIFKFLSSNSKHSNEKETGNYQSEKLGKSDQASEGTMVLRQFSEGSDRKIDRALPHRLKFHRIKGPGVMMGTNSKISNNENVG